MISVALCTYNGGKYIREQLESILFQTEPVGEIVICDDGSTDDTIPIIQQISAKYTGVIKLVQNTSQLGVCANFMQALSLCKGDIVFLSDQDDIWYTNKVEVMSRYLMTHPKIDLVFSDAIFMGGPLDGLKITENIALPQENKRMFSVGLALELSMYQVFAAGSSTAIRKKLIGEIPRPIPAIPMHDYFLQYEAAKRDAIAYLDIPLHHYRMHSEQSSGAGIYQKEILHSIRLKTLSEVWPNPKVLAYVKSDIDQNPRIKARLEYMTERNRLLHDFLGPVKVLTRPLTYHHLYRHNAWRVMKYDITRSVKYTISRFVKKVQR